MSETRAVYRDADGATVLSPNEFFRQYLEMIAGTYERARPGLPFNVYRHLLAHVGEVTEMRRADRLGEPQRCYNNAIERLGHRGWSYVEGYVDVHGLSISHAWCRDAGGQDVEVTLEDKPHLGPWRGIAVPKRAVLKAAVHPRWRIAQGVLGTIAMMTDAELAEVGAWFAEEAP